MQFFNYTKTSVLVFLIIIFNFTSVNAQQTELKVTKIFKETYKYDTTSTQQTFAWWVPNEYWKEFLLYTKLYDRSQINKLTIVLDPYILIYISDKITGLGSQPDQHTPEELIRKNILLIDENKVEYKPIEEELVSLEAKSFVLNMTHLSNPVKGMKDPHYLLYFQNKNSNGKKIADPNKKGFFKIKFYSNEIKWNLPLISLSNPMICPVDGKKMNPEWEYCPWHGKKLLEQSK